MSFGFTTDEGGFYELRVISYEQKININYKLEMRSDRKHSSIDRGSQTDGYMTSLLIAGRTDYLKQLVVELTKLRRSKKAVSLVDIPERIFGDHIDHSGGIDCYVVDFGKELTPRLNVQQIEITFTADTGLLTFYNNAGVPNGLKCLNNSWKGYSEWSTEVQKTYNKDVYFVDSEEDSYTFEGEYVLSVDDNSMLHNWWRSSTIRGNSYNLTESEWGVVDMFGAVGSNSINSVVIDSIEYEYLSPTLRKVKVKILRDGEYSE